MENKLDNDTHITQDCCELIELLLLMCVYAWEPYNYIHLFQ